MTIPRWAAVLGIVAFAIGVVTLLLLMLVDPRSPILEHWRRYERALEGKLRFLASDSSLARRIARGQLAAALILLSLAFVNRAPEPIWIALAVALGPWLVAESLRKARVKRLEGQLDGWLTAVANALRASPSLGEAIESTLQVVRAPMAQEVEQCVKEMRVGTPLDVALINLSARVGSPLLSGALTAVLVGRTTGGNLSALLDQTAASLRESKRLEGLFSSKTKGQRIELTVLAIMPAACLWIVWKMDPNLVRVLTDTPDGLIMLMIAIVLWLGAIAMARGILKGPK